MNKQATHKRHMSSIQDLQTKEVKHYASVNKAKQASREIQLKNDGALGRGSMIAI